MSAATTIAVLITSAGRRVELVELARKHAKDLGHSCIVVAADLRPEWSAACQAADIAVAVPRCTSEEYIPAIRKICQQHSIDLLIPTIDTELLAIAEAHEASPITTEVNISPVAAINIARDKVQTMRVLAAAGVPVPSTWTHTDISVDKLPAQCIIKPRGGSNSQGIEYLSATDAVNYVMSHNAPDTLMVQEVLSGEELTVNCLYDDDRCIAVAHQRHEIRGGEVMRATTVADAQITALAPVLAKTVGLRGVFCFQVIGIPGNYKVIEINARFGGGYPLADAAGASYLKNLMASSVGEIAPWPDQWQAGVRMMRADRSFFIAGT